MLEFIHILKGEINMSIDDFLKNATLEGLATVFFNFQQDKRGNFEVCSSYRSSKYANIELTESIFLTNNQKLKNWSNLDFQYNSTNGHYFTIQKNNQITTSDEFVKNIYKAIQRKRANYSDDEFERILLLALFGLRGSPDPKTNYYAVDIHRSVQTSFYLDCVFKLLTNISDTRQLNLNFRELQPEFIAEKAQRNTQIRINLKWFCEYLNYDLSILNLYKDNILKNQYVEIQGKQEKQDAYDGFLERLIVYRNEIIGQPKQESEELSKQTIQKLREELGFKTDDNDLGTQKRSANIVNIARNIYENACVCCKNNYDISERSFKMRKTGEYYLEIHHVISFASDKKGDQIDNLVKVCPTCHRALTKGRAEESYQRQLIQNIITNSETAKEYVSNFIDQPTNEKIIDYIYQNLQ